MLFFVFVFMPIFIYNSWKGKKLSDYTFSNENIQKMKSKSSKSIK
jgi:type III secretory pathway component EscS